MRQNIGRRIRKARREKGLNQSELSELCGWSSFPARISNYERGLREPKGQDLQKLSRALSMDMAWFYQSEQEVLLAKQSQSVSNEVIQQIPVLAWQNILAFLAHSVTVIKQLDKFISISMDNTHQHLALVVEGECMVSLGQASTFLPGSLIVIELGSATSPGDYILAKGPQDEILFRQLVSDMGQFYLKPLNEKYPIMEMTDEVEILGSVKMNVQRF